MKSKRKIRKSKYLFNKLELNKLDLFNILKKTTANSLYPKKENNTKEN